MPPPNAGEQPDRPMPPPNAGEQPAPVPRPQSPLLGMMPQSPLRIKQGGKFYERLLTKESSAANPSFRYYWAEPGSVPFVWETQPGTPRDDASRMHPGGALPAITPPPSYLLDRHCAEVKAAAASAGSRDRAKAKTSSGGNKQAKGGKKRYRFKRVKIGGFVADMFRRLAVGKAWWRPAVLSPVQVSSSSRWLVATDKQAEHQQKQKQQRRHRGQDPAVLCSGSARQQLSSWMMPFRATGKRNRDYDD